MKKAIDVSTPTEREVLVKREFDAPAQMVFDAHTKAELIKKWLLGPEGWSMPACDIDFRVGGRYRYEWRNDAKPGESFAFIGEFKEIVAPKRIVHTETMEGNPEHAVVTVTFTEKGGRTTVATRMDFGNKTARDGAMATGMTEGMGQSYDRLDQLLVKKAA